MTLPRKGDRGKQLDPVESSELSLRKDGGGIERGGGFQKAQKKQAV